MSTHNFEVSNDEFVEMITSEMNEEFFEGIISMAYHLNINGEKLCEKLAYEYMKYIYEKVNKSKAFIQSHTGFKRSTVTNFVNKYESTKLIPKKKKSDNIFNEFIHKLRAACKGGENLQIPIYGDNSCQTIFHECSLSKGNTFTLPSVLSTLEKAGFIQLFKKHVRYVPKMTEVALRSNSDLNRQFSYVVRDFSSTQIHNKYEHTHEKRFFSQRLNSTDVPDINIQKTIDQFNEKLRQTNKECFELVERNEDLSGEKTTSYQIGIQQYVYLIEK